MNTAIVFRGICLDNSFVKGTPKQVFLTDRESSKSNPVLMRTATVIEEEQRELDGGE